MLEADGAYWVLLYFCTRNGIRVRSKKQVKLFLFCFRYMYFLFYFYLFKRTYCAPDHLVFSFEGLCVYVILAPETARVGQRGDP